MHALMYACMYVLGSGFAELPDAVAAAAAAVRAEGGERVRVHTYPAEAREEVELLVRRQVSLQIEFCQMRVYSS